MQEVVHEKDRRADGERHARGADGLFDGVLAVEVRNAGFAVGIRHGAIDQVAHACLLGRIRDGDALGGLGLHPLLERRAHGIDAIDAGGRADERVLVREITSDDFDALGRQPLRRGRFRVAGEPPDAVPACQ